MVIYNCGMDISVTLFRRRCLELIRRVEATGRSVTILRRGKPVARLGVAAAADPARAPLAQVRAWGGKLMVEPGASVLRDRDFEAHR